MILGVLQNDIEFGFSLAKKNEISERQLRDIVFLFVVFSFC